MRCGFFCLCLLFLAVSPVAARTWHVPADVTTIAAALDFADTGDVVEVAVGSYTETGLVLRPGVSLRGETGIAADVTIDGADQAGILSATNLDDSSEITGITFTAGHALYGGAINLDHSSPLISNCDFRNNWAEYGGAMYCEYSSPQLTGCIFAANGAYGDGGISFFGTSTPLLEQCVFKDNSSYDGAGAVWAIYYVELTVRECEFLRNNSSEHGGAIVMLSGTQLTAEDCRFLENNSDFGAGGAIYWASPGTLTDCRFFGNDAPRGGALCLYDHGITVTGCMFNGNWSTGHGGAIWCLPEYGGPQLPVELVNNTLFGNSVPDGQGVVAAEWGVAIELSNTLLTDSTGGGSVFVDAESTITATCCNIYGNTGGDWIGGIADQFGTNGNLSADPLYCDIQAGNFFVDSDSPCLPDNNDCGVQIGAYGLGCGDTAVESLPTTAGLQLLPNHPNPFNPVTTIKFSLTTASNVRLSVLSLTGHLITTLIDEPRGAGVHEVIWNGRDAAGRHVASGTYLYRLAADGLSITRSMTLIK